MALAYNLVLLLASPLLLAYLVHRLVIRGKSREGFAQRLGWSPALGRPPAAGRIWLHAVSAGEVVAAAAITRRLAELAPEAQVAISTTTPAGQEQARKLLPGAAAHFYFPFDFLPCSALALLRVRPTVVAAVETEIWPNWLLLARCFGIRRALVNGQFADKGFRGARKARFLYRWALGQLDALWMQSRQAAERAGFLGAPADRLRVVGNVKFEQPMPAVKPEAAEAVRSVLALDGGRPLWVAGSTHPGEEEQVLGAFRQVRERVPGLALLLVPRHVERAGEVLELVRTAGWSAARRSAPGEAPVDVLVLDTIGELAGLYSLADAVFVGGSLVPIGGHDILQPLFFDRPTFFGPHMHNQKDLAALAVEAGAAVQVPDAGALAEGLERVLTDAGARETLAGAARELLAENSGAAVECARLLVMLLRGDRATGEPAAGPCGAGA